MSFISDNVEEYIKIKQNPDLGFKYILKQAMIRKKNMDKQTKQTKHDKNKPKPKPKPKPKSEQKSEKKNDLIEQLNEEELCEEDKIAKQKLLEEDEETDSTYDDNIDNDSENEFVTLEKGDIETDDGGDGGDDDDDIDDESMDSIGKIKTYDSDIQFQILDIDSIMLRMMTR